ERAREHRDDGVPERGHTGGRRHDDHAQRLEGTDRDHTGSGRHEPGRADGKGASPGVRVQGEGDAAVGERPERGRNRPRPDPDRRDGRAERLDGHDRRRELLGRRLTVSRRIRVAVLMGGRSSEHDISVASARSVLESLDPDRYEAVTVEIDREGKWQLEPGRSRALDRGAVGELDEGEGQTAVETLPVPTESVPST